MFYIQVAIPTTMKILSSLKNVHTFMSLEISLNTSMVLWQVSYFFQSPLFVRVGTCNVLWFANVDWTISVTWSISAIFVPNCEIRTSFCMAIITSLYLEKIFSFSEDMATIIDYLIAKTCNYILPESYNRERWKKWLYDRLDCA